MSETTASQQKQNSVFDIPILGGFLALIVGFLVPILPTYLLRALALHWFPGWVPEEALLDFLASLAMTVWNVWLWRRKNLVIVTPLIPIPLFVLGLVGIMYQTWKLVFGNGT